MFFADGPHRGVPIARGSHLKKRKKKRKCFWMFLANLRYIYKILRGPLHRTGVENSSDDASVDQIAKKYRLDVSQVMKLKKKFDEFA